MKLLTVTIDGPAGAGKSTIAKKLADKLSVVHLNTGAMYRALSIYLLDNKINIKDESVIENTIKDIIIDVKFVDRKQLVFVNNVDVSNRLRDNEISKITPEISAFRCVRMFVVKNIRNFASKTSCVLDGRDIGSFVLPDAEYKFYLDADIAERAKRRQIELLKSGTDISLQDLIEEISKRDEFDKNKEIAPLIVPKNSIIVDSGNLNIKQVCDLLYSYIK